MQNEKERCCGSLTPVAGVVGGHMITAAATSQREM